MDFFLPWPPEISLQSRPPNRSGWRVPLSVAAGMGMGLLRSLVPFSTVLGGFVGGSAVGAYAARTFDRRVPIIDDL